MRATPALVVVAFFLFASACIGVIGLPDVPDAVDGGVEAGPSDTHPNGHDAGKEAAALEDAPASAGDACEAGAHQCSGNAAVQTCVSGTWGSPVTCPNQACNAGVCSGTCSPGTTRCTSNTQVETCTTTGAWGVSTTCSYVCVGVTNAVGGNCGGSCLAGAKRCSGNGVQTCSTTGQWGTAVACGSATPYCGTGAVCVGPQCVPGGPGLTNCGTTGESCCVSPSVPAGSYDREFQADPDAGITGSDPASVSTFRMDKYEVTVGRFRQFVAAWNAGMGWLPSAGAGTHTNVHSGQGLAQGGGGASTAELGWVVSDDSNIAPTDTNLNCNASYATWTPAAGSNETRPINCVNWWEASAFCIWDGGFLPTEAEWEYVAAGGTQYRNYPWGSADPGTTSQYAIYDCLYPSTSSTCMGVMNLAPVGTVPAGAGLWGQLDLGGELWEWNIDWYASSYLDPCVDCANFTAATDRVFRGGSFYFGGAGLAVQYRSHDAPAGRYYGVGMRCARTP
jgi:sulfatase modifying factor 1